MKKIISWVFLLIFVFMVVGFVLQNHIIDIVDKPTYGSNLPQGDSLDLINKVKPKSVRPQCSEILAIALFPNRFGLKWKLKQINLVKLIIFYHLCSYLCTQIYNQKGIFYVQIRITQRITPSFKKDNILIK